MKGERQNFELKLRAFCAATGCTMATVIRNACDRAIDKVLAENGGIRERHDREHARLVAERAGTGATVLPFVRRRA